MAKKKTPQILENYEISDLIGRGRFAEVFRAIKRDLSREVALKILLPVWNDNEAIRGQFMEQAKLIARLRHPRIVEALDLGEENGRLFMAMEYLPKGNLHEWLKSFGKKRPSLLQVVVLVEDIAAALDFIHSQKISGEDLVHGDVKSDNILLIEERDSPTRLRAKLSDLGLLTVLQKAAIMSGSSAFPQSSPLYISPEQADDKPPTPFSDQYSLGVVTYELLTGQPPFVGGSEVTIYRQHKQTQPQPPSSHVFQLQREIDEVLLKALAKDPSSRYPNCLAFARALRQAVEITNREYLNEMLVEVRTILQSNKSKFSTHDNKVESIFSRLENTYQSEINDPEIKKILDETKRIVLSRRNYEEAMRFLEFARVETQKLRTEAPNYPDPHKLFPQLVPGESPYRGIISQAWKYILLFDSGITVIGVIVFLILGDFERLNTAIIYFLRTPLYVFPLVAILIITIVISFYVKNIRLELPSFQNSFFVLYSKIAKGNPVFVKTNWKGNKSFVPNNMLDNTETIQDAQVDTSKISMSNSRNQDARNPEYQERLSQAPKKSNEIELLFESGRFLKRNKHQGWHLAYNKGGFLDSDPLLNDLIQEALASQDENTALKLCVIRARLERIKRGNPNSIAYWFDLAASYAGDMNIASRYSKMAAQVSNRPHFHLVIRPQRGSVIKEGKFVLLSVKVENDGFGLARDVRLNLMSKQMDITQNDHLFGDIRVGEKKSWRTLQIRPNTNGGLLLDAYVTYQDKYGTSRTLPFEQGVMVLPDHPRQQNITITIDGNVSNSVIMTGDENLVKS